MKVFRLEHLVHGFGPLCMEGCSFHGCDWNQVFDFHVSVCEFDDFETKMGGEINADDFFGMTSKEQLLQMTRMKEFLKNCGFIVATYEVSDPVVFPDGQVVFKKSRAELLRCDELI